MPPVSPPNAEYEFTWSRTSWPILAPSFFAHLLKHPEEICDQQTEIFPWVPKRKLGELGIEGRKQSTHGWGLYFEEGWAVDEIMMLVFLAFAASLVFLISWSKLTSDVSAASGVSAYMIAAVVMVVTLVISKTGRV